MDSSEIAEDFKDALQDLKVNSKPEIDNLTVIARENTAHAQAISKVLQEHIETTRPEWKLPGLYVLDSLIRHVGPPYSTYLGTNLYRTFMEAYRQVGNGVRKDMEAVLRTWKEPAMGSRDPRPVIPIEITQPIENALMKFKNITMQSQQPRPGPGMPGRPPFRDSPTPVPMGLPGMNPADINQLLGHLQNRTAPATSLTQTPPLVRSPLNRPPVAHQPSQNGTPQHLGAQFPPPQTGPALKPSVTQAQLKADVRQLLDSANLQRALNPSNQDSAALIQTLESLKSLLDMQQFGQPDLLAMQGELSKISSRIQSQLVSMLGAGSQVPLPPPPSMPVPNPYTAVSTPPNTMPYMPPATAVPVVAPRPPSVNSTPPVNPNLNVTSLLSLLVPTTSAPPRHTPVPQSHTPSLPINRPVPQTSTPQPGNGSLFDQLMAAGILGATPTPQPAAPSLPFGIPNAVHTSSGKNRHGVSLDQDSITKVRRTNLIHLLYERKSDQCRQCGRRFANTEAGKKAKITHLDWHFRTNSRVADNTRMAIVHRSLFLDEVQWSRLRESIHTTDVDPDEVNGTGTQTKELAESFVPAPTDVSKLNDPCSICMERFVSVWHSKTSQPVWMDAVKIGDKYYHASCWNEVNAGMNAGPRGLAVRSTGASRSTPEPVLGKRKYASAA